MANWQNARAYKYTAAFFSHGIEKNVDPVARSLITGVMHIFTQDDTGATQQVAQFVDYCSPIALKKY